MSCCRVSPMPLSHSLIVQRQTMIYQFSYLTLTDKTFQRREIVSF